PSNAKPSQHKTISSSAKKSRGTESKKRGAGRPRPGFCRLRDVLQLQNTKSPSRTATQHPAEGGRLHVVSSPTAALRDCPSSSEPLLLCYSRTHPPRVACVADSAGRSSRPSSRSGGRGSERRKPCLAGRAARYPAMGTVTTTDMRVPDAIFLLPA